jgi:hypothetical protein
MSCSRHASTIFQGYTSWETRTDENPRVGGSISPPATSLFRNRALARNRLVESNRGLRRFHGLEFQSGNQEARNLARSRAFALFTAAMVNPGAFKSGRTANLKS